MKIKPSMKILIVDDCSTSRLVLKTLLKDQGLKNILSAENGRDALAEMIKADKLNDPIEFVYLDWNMPKLTGVEWISKVREIKQYQSLPVYMVSSNELEDKKKEAIDSGVSGYIVKPIKANDIIQSIIEGVSNAKKVA